MGGFMLGADALFGGGAGAVCVCHHLDDSGRGAGIQQHRVPSGAGGGSGGGGGGPELRGCLHPGGGDHYGAPEPQGDGFLPRPGNPGGDPGGDRRGAAGEAGA